MTDPRAPRSAGVIDTPAGRIFTPAKTPDGNTVLEGYLTEDELAHELGKSKRTIARWRALDEGPPVTRIGRRILYRRTAVKAWLESLEQVAA